MAVFKTQIQDIIGDFDDDVAINQFLTDGAKEIINIQFLVNLVESSQRYAKKPSSA